MRIKKYFLCLSALMFFVSCAGYRPIIDDKNINMSQYKIDLAECQALAERINPAINTATHTAIGAGIGALFGAVLGAAVGIDAGNAAAFGATAGGLTGGTEGAINAATSQKDVIKRCLSGRGYKVLY